MNEQYCEKFRTAVSNWLCDSYSVDIRYIALAIAGRVRIVSASITVHPLPPSYSSNFDINVAELSAGQCQRNGQTRARVFEIIELAIDGKIQVHGCDLNLDTSHTLDYYSEMGTRDRWHSDLHLRVTGPQETSPNNLDFSAIDALLRSHDLPFDGLTDLSTWLGLARPDQFNRAPAIEIRVSPPVDIIFDQSALSADKLKIVLHARPEFDTKRLAIGISAFPGVGLASRKAISTEVVWTLTSAERQEGIAQVTLDHADSVLVMLSIGEITIRRQWFSDPNKARNVRLVAVKQFDRELRMIRTAVLDPQDSFRFETGIAGLLFLLGFSSALQLETDSPDLVVMTPIGRLALVECTLRTSDINSKIGKLVDRCNALRKTLDSSSHRNKVYGVLVCAGPRDQIAIRTAELDVHGIHLVAKEELISAFDQLRFPSDPDKMIDSLEEQVAMRTASIA